MITNNDIQKRAEDIAARRRDGSSWPRYLDRARIELGQAAPTEQLKKIIVRPSFKDEMLHKAGELAA
jgi:hypothetical protein